MISVTSAMVILGTVASSVHGAGLLVFSILLAFRGNLTFVPTEVLIRIYRGWGPVSGVSMGLWILSLLYRYPQVAHPHEEFPWNYLLRWGGLIDNLTLARAIVFGLLWINYTRLEVWVLEPCRQLDQNGTITDPARFEATVSRVTRNLIFNALLFLIVVSLGALGARP